MRIETLSFSAAHFRAPARHLAWMLAPLVLSTAAALASEPTSPGESPATAAATTAAANALPEAPGASLAAGTSSSSSLGEASASLDQDPQSAQAKRPDPQHPTFPRRSSPSDAVVLPGQIAPKQTSRDKFVLSVKDSVSPFGLAGSIISAGYSHGFNNSPNYGTDGQAFAQRVGAAVARNASQNIFSEGILAPVLHEDPRYYQMGNKKNVVHRAAYAATRVLVTRGDNGNERPNLSLLGGYLGAAFLTSTYYPAKNTTVSENLQTYGGSLGGAAIGFVVNEFLSDTLQLLHLKKKAE